MIRSEAMRHFAFLLATLAWAQTPNLAPTTVPANVQADLDVEYSRVGERVFVDIFRPKETTGAHPTAHPAVLAIHGGGFRAGKRTSYHPLCIKLAQRGYTCATMSYRLAPRHQFPAPVEDAKAAVRFLRANARKYDMEIGEIGEIGAPPTLPDFFLTLSYQIT